jgi:penicillin amidase
MHPPTRLACAFIPALLAAACSTQSPVETLPVTTTFHNDALTSNVDLIRDEWGIPHIYGDNLPDVAFVEGYVMGMDRLVQMDLVRHNAAGTLTELGGAISPGLFDGDVRMRTHHLRSTAQAAWDELSMSSDPDDQLLTQTLTSFAAGVNAYLADLQAGNYSLPPALAFDYDPSTTQPWSEVDSILVGMQIAFNLSFDADSDIYRSQLDAAAALLFDNSNVPAQLMRKGIGQDLQRLQPIDPTFTLPGDLSNLGPIAQSATLGADALALLQADDASVSRLGLARRDFPARGSNNFVIGPQLSATGHTLVANDPHLALQNPATFYLLQLVVRGGKYPVSMMGAQFAGAPGVILGHNARVAWAATTSNLDVTDVYRETVVPCDASNNPCVMFNGQKVALVPRQEKFDIGRLGTIVSSRTVTLWDVPQHGPIIPRVKPDHSDVEALGSQELSVRWTGHQPSQLLRALFGLDKAASVKEAAEALQRDFRVGGVNWVLGDDQGHFGWTQTTEVPRRPAGTVPWKVMAGDGSAEWLGDLDLAWVPHAFDVDAGFLVTANADPVGVTADGEPFASEPVVDGIPLYIGADFDPGTRVGRITKRIQELVAQGNKISVDDLQSIQADDVSEWDQLLAPTLLDATQAILEEIATPGAHPELTALLSTADAPSKMNVQAVHDDVAAWDFSTKSDSRAALFFNVWVTRFALLAFEDELDLLASQNVTIGTNGQLKLLVTMCTDPTKLATPLSSVGDSILFDDSNTPEIESKRLIAAEAVFDMLDYLLADKTLGPDVSTWSWGKLHTLTLTGLLPVDALQIPLKGDAMFPNGFPRHGDNGTVDVGQHGLAVDDFTYTDGPVIRAVYELDPAGPHAKNALPGGETFDPQSPHYRDLLDLWRENQTFDHAFTEADAVASAKKEIAAHGGGRMRFSPK